MNAYKMHEVRMFLQDAFILAASLVGGYIYLDRTGKIDEWKQKREEKKAEKKAKKIIIDATYKEHEEENKK